MRNLTAAVLVLLLFTTACGLFSSGGNQAGEAELDAVSDSGVQVADLGNGILVEAESPPVTVTGSGVLAANTKLISEDALYHATIVPGLLEVPAVDVPLLPDLKVGDIVACAEKGVLRRITELEWAGDDRLIRTEEATLAEAFDEGDFAMHVGFGKDDGKADAPDGGTRAWVSASLNNTTLYESEDGGFKLSIEKGQIRATPDFDFNLSFSGTKILLAEVLTTGNVLVELQLKVEGEFEKDFKKSKEIPLFEKSSVVMFGVLPVKVTPFVQISIGVEGKVEGKAEATAGSKITIPLVHQYKYDPKQSDHFVYTSHGKVNASAQPAMTTKGEGAFETRVFAEIQFGMRIYDRLSASINLGPYAKAEVKLNPTCTYTLSAGVGGNFSVHLDALGSLVEEQDEDWEIVDFPTILSSGNCKEGETGLEGVLCDAATVTNNVAKWPDGMDKCTVLNGTLEISGNTDNIDLSPLKNIEAVKGDVLIKDNSQLTDLSWLSSLKTVEGSVILSANPNLTDVSALDSLETVTLGLQIADNNALVGLPYFTRLTNLGNLYISRNESLTKIIGFDAVVSKMESVTIADNGPMTEINALSQVTSVVPGEVKIAGKVDSLAVFDALQDAGGVRVSFEGAVINSFGALRVVTGPLFFSGLKCQSVGGTFDSVISVVETLGINCQDCVQIPSFPTLSTVKVKENDWSGMPGIFVTLETETGQLLTTMPSFASVAEVDGQVDVRAMSVTDTTVNLFPSLESARGGNVAVNLSEAVTKLSGFQKLQVVDFDLFISGGSLTEVSGFKALTSVREITIEGPLVAVPNFDALEELGDFVNSEPETLPHYGTLPDFGPKLKTYPTMAKLKQAGYLRIWNNDTMTDFGGLTGLEQIQTLEFQDCDNLSTITGLTSLKEVGGLYSEDPFPANNNHGSLQARYCPLSDVSGLSSLETVEKDLHLPVCEGNPMALAALTSVGGYLGVCSDSDHYCASLDWFDGMSKGGGTLSGTPPEGGCL